MIVLKIIGFVLLGILALIIIALCLKIRIEVEYSSENTSVVLKCLFLSIPIYPKKKSEKTDAKKEKAKKDKKEKTEELPPAAEEKKEEPAETLPEAAEPADEAGDGAGTGEGGEEKKEPAAEGKKSGVSDLLKTLYNAEGVDGLLLIAKRTCRYLGTFFGGLLRWIVVNEFYLDVRCTRSDAASTAIYYGEVCSSLFPMLGSLVSKCKVRKYDINVYPDFLARFSSAQFILKFYFIPIVMVGHTLALVCKLIFKVALQVLVKIFLYLKGNKNTGNDKKNIKGKSEVTNE